MPDPAAAPLALAPAAQRTEWLDVVVPEGVEAGAKFRFAYGGVLCKAKSGPARFPSCGADLGG